MKATRKITKLRVREMSLVGEGDNPHADVLILKHRQIVGVDLDVVKTKLAEVRTGAIAIAKGLSEGRTTEMDIEELTSKLDQIEKSLTDAQSANTQLQAQVTDLSGKLETVTKERDAALADVEKAKGGKGEDDVLKGLPQAVIERIEKSEADAKALREEIEKERDERATTEIVEKVRATGLKDADKFGALIRRVQKGKSTAEDADALLDLVAKSAALVKGESMLFTSIGKAKGEGGDEVDVAKAKLDEATAAIQKAKPTITKEAAYMEACEANPDAYAALRNGPKA